MHTQRRLIRRNKNILGSLFDVSKLTLGVGGMGQVWGETNRQEAEATVKAAYDAGISSFDLAPSYGEVEAILGACFGGAYPEDIPVATKCLVGGIEANLIGDKLDQSLEESLKRLNRDHIDVFVLHGFVIDPAEFSKERQELMSPVTVTESAFQDAIVPRFESWKAQGKYSLGA